MRFCSNNLIAFRYFSKQLLLKIFTTTATTSLVAAAWCLPQTRDRSARSFSLLIATPERPRWRNPLAVDSWRNSLGIRRHRLEWWQTACTAKHTIAPWWLRLQVRPMARGWKCEREEEGAEADCSARAMRLCTPVATYSWQKRLRRREIV